MDWKEKFEDLEGISRTLEPGARIRASMTGKALEYSEAFLDGLDEGQTFIEDRGQSGKLDVGIGETATGMDELLQVLGSCVDTPGINPASGGHFGYIPGGGIFPSAVGDFLADVSNRYSGVHFASPGAAQMEKQLIDWIAGLVDYPDSAGGDPE